MGRPRRISNEQILKVMRTCVLEHGPNVSLDVVAAELEVTTPALLKRFGSRSALLIAALRPPEAPEWIDALAKGPGPEPLETQLREHLGRICAFMLETIPCIQALRESGTSMTKVFDNGTRPDRGLRALQRWLELAKKKGLVLASETEVAADAMLGAIQSRAFFAHVFHKTFTPRAQRVYVNELASFFARALATRADASRAKLSPPSNLH